VVGQGEAWLFRSTSSRSFGGREYNVAVDGVVAPRVQQCSGGPGSPLVTSLHCWSITGVRGGISHEWSIHLPNSGH
jgi:hypothetical protein